MDGARAGEADGRPAVVAAQAEAARIDGEAGQGSEGDAAERRSQRDRCGECQRGVGIRLAVEGGEGVVDVGFGGDVRHLGRSPRVVTMVVPELIAGSGCGYNSESGLRVRLPASRIF